MAAKNESNNGDDKGGRSLYMTERLRLAKATIKIKEKAEKEFSLYKTLYLKLLNTGLNKDQMRSLIEKEFKKNNYKFNRDKFFVLQNQMKEEEIRKDWWMTKRIEELKSMTGRKIISIMVNPDGIPLESFEKTKSEKIVAGKKKGSKKGGTATKNKFI